MMSCRDFSDVMASRSSEVRLSLVRFSVELCMFSLTALIKVSRDLSLPIGGVQELQQKRICATLMFGNI